MDVVQDHCRTVARPSWNRCMRCVTCDGLGTGVHGAQCGCNLLRTSSRILLVLFVVSVLYHIHFSHRGLSHRLRFQ